MSCGLFPNCTGCWGANGARLEFSAALRPAARAGGREPSHAGQDRRIQASSGEGIVVPRDEEHFHLSYLGRPALSLLNGRPPLTEHPCADVARRRT